MPLAVAPAAVAVVVVATAMVMVPAPAAAMMTEQGSAKVARGKQLGWEIRLEFHGIPGLFQFWTF